MNEHQMHAELRRFVERAGTQKNASERLCISPQYLNDILGKRREISAVVAASLGYTRKVVFKKAG